MMKAGYNPELAAGTVCAVGTLGILIPPSIMLVLMADRLAMSVGDLFLGKEGSKTPHDRFFFNARNTLRAVRSGPWKLFLNGPLHNLDENLGETKNFASQRPGVVKRLKGYMAEFERDLKKNSRPVGVAKDPKTLVPRPGAKGEDAYTPTLWIGKTK